MLAAILFLIGSYLIGLSVSRRLMFINAGILAIAFGLIIGTWTVFLSSLVFGFTTVSIVLASLLILAIALHDLPFHELSKSVRKESYVPYAFLAISFLAFLVLSSALLHWDSSGNIIGNGKDLGFYLAISTSISEGNFPPQYPVAASDPLSYYYFFSFMASILFKGGIPLFISFNLVSAIFLSGLFTFVFIMASSLFRSHRTGVFSVFLLLFAGGLHFLPYLEFVDLSNPQVISEILLNPRLLTQYQSYGYPVHNILLTSVTARPDLAGLFFFTAAAAFLLLRKRLSSVWMGISGGLFGLTAMFSVPLAMVTLSALVIYLAFFDSEAVKNRFHLLVPFGIGLVLALVIQLPIFLPKLVSANAHFAFAPLEFLSETPFSDPLTFWTANFGFWLLAGIAGYFLAPSKLKKIALSLLPSFLFLNLFQFAPWYVDQFKLALPVLVILVLLSIPLYRRVYSIRRFGPSLVILLVLSSSLTGYLNVISITQFASADAPERPICNASAVQFSEFVRLNTPPSSVFISDPETDVSCLTAFSGRLAFYSNGKWIENHGLNRTIKEKQNQDMLKGDCELLKRLDIHYAYEDENSGWRIPQSLKEISTLVHSRSDLRLYQIHCPN